MERHAQIYFREVNEEWEKNRLEVVLHTPPSSQSSPLFLIYFPRVNAPNFRMFYGKNKTDVLSLFYFRNYFE